MWQPWLGEIVLFPYWFVPEGWATCDGSALAIREYTALFSLLGHRFSDKTYPDRFHLPDYQELAPADLRYCIAVTGNYPQGDLTSYRERGAGEVAIAAFEPKDIGNGPWKARAASPALPGATFLVAKNGEAAPPDPFVGEVRLFEGTTPPSPWLRCDGQERRITQGQALYSLIGTKFGGDGQATFKLPDLRSHEAAGARYFMPIEGVYPTRPR